ncbi:E3 ubiquitin-protein ligase ATL6-like [Aristolochia californica]|uniref:E3 ubiquitin-protein ligase ATL6-like n=1 Tax=Aristolochia californica TaxID=171875 RepID=UPI0035D55E99
MAIVNHYVVCFLLLLVPFSTCQPPEGSPPDSSTLEISINPRSDFILFAVVAVLAIYYLLSNFIQRSSPDVRPLFLGRSWAAASLWLPPPSSGVDRSVINTFPMFQYSVVKDRKLDKSSSECAVCLNEFKAEDTIRLLPRCNHVFHLVCIDAWLTDHTTCPICRSDLLQGPPDADVSTGHEGGKFSEVNQRVAANGGAIAVDEEQTMAVRQMGISQSTTTPTPTPEARASQRRNLLGRFWRSNSTGHSIMQSGENFERFTPRLREEIRVDLNTISGVASPPEGSGNNLHR